MHATRDSSERVDHGDRIAAVSHHERRNVFPLYLEFFVLRYLLTLNRYSNDPPYRLTLGDRMRAVSDAYLQIGSCLYTWTFAHLGLQRGRG
jgi:hypothetical protein